MSDTPIPSLDKLVETFRKAEAEWAGHRPPVSRETHILAAVLPLVLRGTMEALEPFRIMADQIDEWQKGSEARVDFSFDANDLRAARTVRDQIAALIGG